MSNYFGELCKTTGIGLLARKDGTNYVLGTNYAGKLMWGPFEIPHVLTLWEWGHRGDIKRPEDAVGQEQHVDPKEYTDVLKGRKRSKTTQELRIKKVIECLKSGGTMEDVRNMEKFMALRQSLIQRRS